MHDPGRPVLAILLATRNGADMLGAQLDSFVAQSRPPDLVMVSDDGSTDGTRAVVQAFAVAHPEIRVDLREGPCRGASENFLSLLRAVPEEVDIVAFSDQDDVWVADKLARGIAALARAGREDPGRPALYCGCTWECDQALRRKRRSRRPRRAIGFRHALVQNIAGGNTMMLDRAGLELARGASRETSAIVVHDWWLYQIVAGAGGRVIFDSEPVLYYRQHPNNLIGANRGPRAKLRRLRHMLTGGFRDWNTVNIRALTASAHRLTPENRAVLERFARDRAAPLTARLTMLHETGVYRQGIEGTLSLWAAALIGRL